jgi:aspartyl-tRNA(Asn)/glutamyl-tRNA(Gln) amidotransferase subunit C
MAKLKKNEIKHVAELAKLPLSDSEITKFEKQLSEVINYVGQLNEVDTEGIIPTSQTTGLENVFRADEPKSDNSLSQEAVLSGSDKTHNGYFVVDAVINKDG